MARQTFSEGQSVMVYYVKEYTGEQIWHEATVIESDHKEAQWGSSSKVFTHYVRVRQPNRWDKMTFRDRKVRNARNRILPTAEYKDTIGKQNAAIAEAREIKAQEYQRNLSAGLAALVENIRKGTPEEASDALEPFVDRLAVAHHGSQIQS